MRFAVNTTQITGVARELHAAPAEIRKRWQATLFDAGQRMVNIVKREYRGATATTDTATAVRTGRLQREVAAVTARDSGGPEVRVGWMRPRASSKALEYAAIHEYGGVIRPKNARFLSIPLNAAKTRRGVDRGGPRSYVDAFPIRLRDGRLFLVRRRFLRGSAHQKLEFLYRLQTGPITIKARPSLLPAYERVVPRAEEQLLADAVSVVGGQ